jgi:hypothetical protein
VRNSAILLRLAFIHGTRGSFGPDASYTVFYVDRHQSYGNCPPEFSDGPISRQPGVGLLKFVSHKHFSCIDRRALGDQVLIRWDARDPGSSGRVLMVKHQLVSGEAQSFSAADGGHESYKLLVDHSLWLMRRRCVRKRSRRCGFGCAIFVFRSTQHTLRRTALGLA